MFTMGMIGNKIAYKTFENYLKVFVPLAVTSVALSLAFKMRFWNIGGEGQFILGAVAAATVAFKLGPSLPQGVTLLLMCLAAMLAAGLYGSIVAVLKVKFGTNETLMTLMLNYIALYFLTFLGETQAEWNFYLDPTSARPMFASFAKTVAFPKVLSIGKFGLNLCVVITFLIGILVFVYLKYTKHGYEIAVVGDSAGTARYAGMKVNVIVLRTVFLSACLVGLAAAFKVGTAGILSTAITDDVGWTGVIVAWLAQLNTAVIFLVSALIGMLQYGSTVAAATFSQVDSSFAKMLQGAILFLVLAADFYTRFRVVPVQKGGKTSG
jgi:simple sugar transport system permease protein